MPQLRTITIGGAVTGLGIEASSFRNGLPHESVLEMRILTGAGEVVTATPDGEHADLFRTFPNSYGSLGYVLDLVIELEPALPYVCLRHVRFPSVEQLALVVDEVMATRAHEGERVDFVDGVVFSATECYLTLARWTDDLEGRVRPSDYTGDQVFYRSIQTRRRDLLTAHDYLWRWDTDWFWCSRAFGAQVPAVRRLWPRHLLRSDVYWRIVAFEHRHRVMGRIDRLRGQPAARARRAGRRDPARPHGRLRHVVPARGADRADLAVPHPAPSPRATGSEVSQAGTRPGRSTRCAPTSATSTSASGRPSPSRPAQPMVTSTAPSSGR